MTETNIQYPNIIDNFITNSECKTLLDLAENNEDLFQAQTSSIPRWNKRNIYMHMILKNHKSESELLLQIANKIQHKIREIENTNDIWLELPMYSRWLPGDHLNPPHADNIEQDGKTPNSSPWRSHGIVLYLNNTFDGGEIFYKHHNLKFKPKPKTCGIHRAGIDDTHGVFEVQNGIRHTIITFACRDEAHVQKSKPTFLDGYLDKI